MFELVQIAVDFVSYPAKLIMQMPFIMSWALKIHAYVFDDVRVEAMSRFLPD